jgi:hypothetical protein
VRIHLTSRYVERTTHPVKNTSHYLAFVFQRPTLADEQPDCEGTDYHLSKQ